MKNGLIISNSDKYWYINDKLHRTDGPAVENSNGDKSWWINDKRHREDGPAVERANGDKLWFINGKRHREDGPAIEYANGDKLWFINDKELTKQEFNEHLKDLELQRLREEIKNMPEKSYDPINDLEL